MYETEHPTVRVHPETGERSLVGSPIMTVTSVAAIDEVPEDLRARGPSARPACTPSCTCS